MIAVRVEFEINLQKILCGYWYYLKLSCFVIVVSAITSAVARIDQTLDPITAYDIIKISLQTFVVSPAVLALIDEIVDYCVSRGKK